MEFFGDPAGLSEGAGPRFVPAFHLAIALRARETGEYLLAGAKLINVFASRMAWHSEAALYLSR
jgi:hypothetical protein